MISIKEESFKDCVEELKPLFEEHYKEVALYQDKVSLNPDYDKYFLLEDSGNLHTVIVREEDKIVGYYISIVTGHIHYMDTLYACNDIVYIDHKYRHSGVAKEMVEFAEKKLKDLGVSVMTVHMKTYLPFESLASSVGFDKVEYLYSKYIGN